MTVHLVISDIHGDANALRLLLEKYKEHYQDIWCLGDVPGHGEHLNGDANSAECYQILYEYKKNDQLTCVKGNWECWVSQSPNSARSAQERWNNQILDEQQKIESLRDWVVEFDWLIENDEFTLTHGWIETLIDQRNSEPCETYLDEKHRDQVATAFLLNKVKTDHVLVGHTHNPGFFMYNGKRASWVPLTSDMIDKDLKYDRHRYVLNPGALSGARDEKYQNLKTALLINTSEKSFRFISL